MLPACQKVFEHEGLFASLIPAPKNNIKKLKISDIKPCILNILLLNLLVYMNKGCFSLLQVITELVAGDQVNVIATGYFADVETCYFLAHGYTSFTGFQLRTGLA